MMRPGSAGGAPTRVRADVTYYQFMGKDNVPFHTLSFPATILGLGRALEAGRLPEKSFNYLNYDGGQFSDFARAWGLHGSGALDPSKRITGAGGCLSACPRDFGRRIHLGEFPGFGEQGPGRCPGQPSSPA